MPVSIAPSSAVLNMIEIRIEGEGHTVASALTERLESDPSCQFAGYSINHPNDSFVTLNVKGNETKNAKDVLKHGLVGMIKDIDDLIRQLKTN